MISNRCARKYLVTNCNSIISKNYLRFLVDSNDIKIQLNIYTILLLFLPSVCLCSFGRTINLKENYIPSPEILFVIISFISIFAFLSISISINNIKGFFLKFKNAILFLGKNTLIILALHMLFINLSLLFIKPFFEIHILYKLVEYYWCDKIALVLNLIK